MIDVSPSSQGNKFRQRRIEMLNDLVRSVASETGRCSIIDIGGTDVFWSTWSDWIDWSVVRVTCVNLNPQQVANPNDRISVATGDACDLSRYDTDEFDIAFSNSVIEHVGGWEDMKAMASEVRRVGRAYLVQSPYFWFPIEPHARTPFIHWLPEQIAYRILMRRDCGFWQRCDNISDALRVVRSARLLDARQYAELFPDAILVRERFLGLTKSLIAVRKTD